MNFVNVVRDVWMSNETVSDWREFPNGRCAVIERMGGGMAYLKADLTMGGNDECWCYVSYARAKAALDAWDGTGEPAGWFRHPDTGRRRPDGDASLEYIQR